MSTDAQFKRFKKLPEEFRNELQGKNADEIKKDMLTWTINNIVLALAKAADPDLARLQEELSTAKAVYTEGTKTNNLRIEFGVEVLRSQGVDIPDVSAFCAALKDEVDEDASAEELIATHEQAAAESHASVNQLVEKFTDGVAKRIGKGNSVTISVPRMGKSVTIEGED